MTMLTFQINGGTKNNTNISVNGLTSTSSAIEINRFPLPDPSMEGISFNGEKLLLGDGTRLYYINITDGSTITSVTNSSRRYNSLAWGDDALWATSYDLTKIIKIDPITLEEILTLDHPWSAVNGLAWSVEGLYVYDDSIDKIYQLNDSTGQVISNYDYFSDTGGIEVHNGFLWATMISGEKLIKTTTDTGTQIGFIDIDVSTMYLRGLTFINNNLWVIDDYADSLIEYDISGIADLVIYPDQDTYVNSISKNEINGLKSIISVRDYRDLYLRFPLSQVQYIDSVFLEIYQANTNILDVEIYGVQSDLWDQLTMNWNNRIPVTTNEIGSIHILGKNYYSLNVTEFISSQSDGWATFVIKTQSPSEFLELYSIESSSSQYWPMLSINGTIYRSEIVPGPITTTFSTTETDTRTITQTDAITNTETTSFTETIAETTITETSIESFTNTMKDSTTIISTTTEESPLSLFVFVGIMCMGLIRRKLK